MELAKQYLISNLYSIEEIAHYCGFSTIGNFSRKFKQEFGINPIRFRHNSLSPGFKSNDWKIPLDINSFNKLIRLKTENKWVVKILFIIINNLDKELFSIEILAQKLFMSSTTLNRKVKSLFGFPTARLLRDIRLQYGTELIVLHKKSVTEAASMAGFSDVAHFSHCFKENFGCSPKNYSAPSTFFPFIDFIRKEL